MCSEMLFNPFFYRIDKKLVDSFITCNINVRKGFYADIVFSGGTTIFERFYVQIDKEVNVLAAHALNIKTIESEERKY
jgi:actin-related protein